MAVLVPDVNIPYTHKEPVRKKRILSLFRWEVILKIMNVMADDAMLQPKFAASEKKEKYLIIPLTIWVLAA